MRHISAAALVIAAAVGLSIGLTQPLAAADIPAKAPRPAPLVYAPVYSWTGCYVGGNAGAAWNGGNFTDPNGATASGTNSGFVGGVQIGCDYQAGPFVVGFRNLSDWSTLNSSGTFASGALNGFTANTNTKWFDALTGRVGYAVQPNWLLYVQGGGVWTRTNQYINSPANVQVAQFASNRTGWTIGGGSEYMFAPNWSVFVEYNYMDFGTSTAVVTGVGPVNAKLQSQNVMIGLNWRWNAASAPGRY